MNKKYLKEILEQYQAKRSFAILLSEQEQEKAYKIADYQILDRQERLVVLEIGKLIFENKDHSLLTKQLENIKKQKEIVLKNNDVDIKKLSPVFDCKSCNDTGFVDGKPCKCLHQNYNNYIMKLSNIDLSKTPSLKEYSFNCFEEEQKQNMKKIVCNLQKFADNLLSAQTKNIVLVGGTGVGKTYLAKSVAKEVLNKSLTAFFISAFGLNNQFLKIHTSREENKNSLLQPLIDVDLLIIDDLGTEPILQNVSKEYLLLLINERLNANKSTIITTNLQPYNILSIYGDRIYSRLNNKENCALFNLQGKDLRVS